jgi:hypothetical protein
VARARRTCDVAGIGPPTLLIALLLSACAGLRGDQESAGPLAGPKGSPSPTVTGAPGGDIAFVLQESYRAGEKVDVKITNQGDRAYEYNSTGYEACNLTYRDQTGRDFIIPPGTHCDLIAIEEIEPGQTVTLFQWQLDECVKDNWGCVKSEPLEPGTYTIEGRFKAADGGPPAHAEATFEIALG